MQLALLTKYSSVRVYINFVGHIHLPLIFKIPIGFPRQEKHNLAISEQPYAYLCQYDGECFQSWSCG